MQKKSHSLIEGICNILIGGSINMFIFYTIIASYLGTTVSMNQSFWVTVIYTVISICRQYVFRRVFNKITYNQWRLEND